MQDGVYAKAEAVGNALEVARGTDDSDVARDLAERCMAGSLREDSYGFE